MYTTASILKSRKCKVSFMKKARRILATVLLVAMSLSIMLVNASAAEIEANGQTSAIMESAHRATESNNAAILPATPMYTNYYWVGSPHEQWVLVVNNQNGINSTVKLTIEDFNAVLYQMDIKLNGRDGLLYQLDNCTKWGNEYSCWCGSDVVGVWVRIQPRAALITGDRSFRVKVEY